MLPEIEIAEVTHKMGMNRKTAHSYAKAFNGNFGQVRDVIIVEATWLGYYEPYTRKNVDSYIGKMMSNNGQAEIAKENGLLPFEVLVLEPVRTLCEKIMSLVRFSYSEDAVGDLKKKIRHTYDLHQLLQQKELFYFFHSSEFEIMLLTVANDDVVSFKNNNNWLNNHPVEALIFKELDVVWNDLKGTYNSSFRNLVYGDLPNEEAVFVTLKAVKERLILITWNIEI